MRNRWVLMGVMLTIIGIFVVGCYTILSHPRVEGEEGETYSGRYYRDNCTDCHADYHNYPYGYYYGYYPDYYWNYPRWGHYYIYPWWWDWYWWDDGGGGGIIQQEKIERRGRSLEPPYVPSTQGSSPSVIESKSTRTNTPNVTIDRKTEQQQPQQQEGKKEEKKEEKIERKKR